MNCGMNDDGQRAVTDELGKNEKGQLTSLNAKPTATAATTPKTLIISVGAIGRGRRRSEKESK